MKIPSDDLRYQCQLHLPEWSVDTQQKLKKSSVLCIGAGGLAHGALPYLAAAGLGQIGIMDGDQVELANLHRQVLFTPEDIGKNKAEVVAIHLHRQNPAVKCTAYLQYFSAENAFDILRQYDLILDCSDNFYTRYLINDVAYFLNKPNVSAAVVGYEGHISVYLKRKSPCYRCLHSAPPPLENTKNCADFGVLGTMPGIFGLLQATEAIKVLTGIGKPLYGKLLGYRAHDGEYTRLEIYPKRDCILCALHQSFESLPRYEEYSPIAVKTILSEELKLRLDEPQYFILDVRESGERAQFHIPSHHIPMSEFQNRFAELPRDRKIVVYCAHGIRSARAAALLKKAGYSSVFTLKDGISAWKK